MIDQGRDQGSVLPGRHRRARPEQRGAHADAGGTGGDGIGALDPIFLRLPNSGFLVQFTMMFGLNADGSSSEEAGTTPDVRSPAGEPPLITALRAALAERKS